MSAAPITESDYQRHCNEGETFLSVIKETEKVKIEKVSSRLLHAYGRECVRKRYKSRDGRDTQALVDEYLKLREIQKDSAVFARHSPLIYRVCLVEVQDGSLDACILEDYIRGETIEEKLQQKENAFQEYLSNKTDYLNKQIPEPSRGFSETEVFSYMIQLCAGLDVLHKRFIIHRDIKPQNLMMTEDGNICKIIDFDISREYKENKSEDTVFAGTKGYCAPEQRGGGQSSPATDVYGIGVTMHMMLVGISEHVKVTQGKDFCYVHNQISYHGPLRNVIIKCTRSDPEQRYKDAGELKEALEKLYDETNSFTNETNVNNAKKKPDLRIITLALLFCAALLLLLKGINTLNHPSVENNASETIASMKESTVQESSEAPEMAASTESGPSQPELSGSELLQSESSGSELLQSESSGSEPLQSESSGSASSEYNNTLASIKHDPPYDWRYQPLRYETDNVVDLIDCSEDYYYITETQDPDGSNHYDIRSGNGTVINIDEYTKDTDSIDPPARLVYNPQKKELYLVVDSLKIYLVNNQLPFTLLFESAETPVRSVFPDMDWNCIVLEDGTLFCGTTGSYIDTDTWKEKGKIDYSYIIPSRDYVYAGFKENGDFTKLDMRGKPDYNDMISGDNGIFSDGEKIYIYSHSPGVIWLPREEENYIYIRISDLLNVCFLQKTDYGILFYDNDTKQIMKILVDE